MSETVETVSTTALKTGVGNVREEPGDLSELVASIKSVGVLEPLLVDEAGVVVCGMRRYLAAEQCGVKVPVIRRAFTPEERLVVQVVENVQRQSLTPLEEARAFDRLRDELTLTTRQIGSRIGVSQSWVVKRLSLLKLPETTQKAVGEGKIEIGAAMEIVKVADDPKLVEALAQKAASGSTYIAQDVARAIETRDREKEQKQKEAALKKGGEKTVVHVESDGYNAKPPKGVAIVTAAGYYVAGQSVVMAPGTHAKKACHAVGVHPRTLEVVELCTDPKQHPDPALQRKKVDDKRKAEAAAEKEQDRQELEQIVDWLRVIAKKPAVEQVIEVAYLALSDPGYAYGSGELAIRVLDLPEPPEPKEGEESIDVDEWFEAAMEKLAETPAGRLRLTFAHAIERLWGLRELEAGLELLGYEQPKPELKVVGSDETKAKAA